MPRNVMYDAIQERYKIWIIILKKIPEHENDVMKLFNYYAQNSYAAYLEEMFQINFFKVF